ncbi:MAG: hypothetical protein L0Y76_00520 [Ignavibacteria bacterium]|nr:hypothetical protein [Ignavibacteria bacterium]
MKIYFPLISLLLAFLLLSCGKNEQVQDKKTDSINAPKTEITETAGEKKQGDTTTKSELGLKSGLPEDFPKDVPQPPNSTCHGSIFNQTDGTTVTFVSKSKVMEIVNFYKEEMKKNSFVQEQGSDELVSDKGGLVKWTKGNREVELMMSFKSETNETDIVLSYKDKK